MARVYPCSFSYKLVYEIKLMHLSEVTMFTKKYGHLKKMIFYIARKIIIQKRWI